MRDPSRRRWRWSPRYGLRIGLASLGLLGVTYPFFDQVTQSPLGIFILPILVVAVLGSWQETALIGVLSLAVAIPEGVAEVRLDGPGLAARIAQISLSSIIAIVLNIQRQRRQGLIDEARAHQAVTDAFESSLAPTPAPPASLLVTARLIPDESRLRLAGNFFDALELPDGSLGYIIGDVCGHGAEAAAVGAAVRAGWKSLAIATPDDPVAWTCGLQRAFFGPRMRDTYVTLNTGRLDAGMSEWVFVSAGHPWPVLVGDDVAAIEPSTGPPVGAFSEERWMSTTVRVPAHATIFWYTDGLTETQDAVRQQLDGEQKLIEYLRTAPVEVDAVLAHFARGGFRDDVAVMAISSAERQ